MAKGKTYIVPLGTRTHLAMPTNRQIVLTVRYLKGAVKDATDSDEIMEAREIVALWLEQQMRERTTKLERRLAGGRVR
jgi:hypothetical protein